MFEVVKLGLQGCRCLVASYFRVCPTKLARTRCPTIYRLEKMVGPCSRTVSIAGQVDTRTGNVDARFADG